MFSKQHYEQVAKTLKQAGDAYPGTVNRGTAFQYHEYLIDRLVAMFQDDNPLFSSERFYKACGLDS